MFGKRSLPAPEGDATAVLGPLKIGGLIPGLWIAVPAEFPSFDEQMKWTRQTAQSYRAARPDCSKKAATGLSVRLAEETSRRYSGHEARFALIVDSAAGKLAHLSALFDLSSASAGSLERTELSLGDAAGLKLEVHPDWYLEQLAAPVQATDVKSVSLGQGRCVVRRDRYRVTASAFADVLDPEQLVQYNDPQFWDQALSIYWLFTVSGEDLLVSVRSEEPGALGRAVPRICEFIDAVSMASDEPRTGAPSDWRACEAAVAQAAAAVDADQRMLLDRAD